MYEHFEHNVVGGIPQRIHQCPDCDEAFTQRDSVQFHRYVKHRKEEKPDIPEEWKLFYRPRNLDKTDLNTNGLKTNSIMETAGPSLTARRTSYTDKNGNTDSSDDDEPEDETANSGKSGNKPEQQADPDSRLFGSGSTLISDSPFGLKNSELKFNDFGGGDVTQVPSPKVVMIRLLPKDIGEFRTSAADLGFCKSSESSSSSTSDSSSASDSDSDDDEKSESKQKLTDQNDWKASYDQEKSKSNRQEASLMSSVLKPTKVPSSNSGAVTPSQGSMGKKPNSRARPRKRAASSSDDDDDDTDDGNDTTPLKKAKRVRRRTKKVDLAENAFQKTSEKEEEQRRPNLNITGTSEASQCDDLNMPAPSLVNNDPKLCSYCLKHFSTPTNVLRHVKLRCPVVKNLRQKSMLN